MNVSNLSLSLRFKLNGRRATNVSLSPLNIFPYWQENENFDADGIQLEPFNLDKEREEGYFDAAGNFVEYVNDKEIKVRRDVWFSMPFLK